MVAHFCLSQLLQMSLFPVFYSLSVKLQHSLIHSNSQVKSKQNKLGSNSMGMVWSSSRKPEQIWQLILYNNTYMICLPSRFDLSRYRTAQTLSQGQDSVTVISSTHLYCLRVSYLPAFVSRILVARTRTIFTNRRKFSCKKDKLLVNFNIFFL